jgi:hypothetical protein
VLLTDADNIFVKYLDTREFERDVYDVIHAYCYNFPIRFLSMGFTVCGGMVWLKGNEPGTKNDGPAVRYVLKILEQCEWSGINDKGKLKLEYLGQNISDSERNFNVSDTHSYDLAPIKAPAAKCDDQQVINSKFFSNTLMYTWDKIPNNIFWKHETSGRSLVTGHRFKIWDVDTAYRGDVDGYHWETDAAGNNVTSVESRRQCPDVDRNWVAMTGHAIGEKKNMNIAEERILRVKQWYEFCRNETVDGQ